jgi:hypothetical protein
LKKDNSGMTMYQSTITTTKALADATKPIHDNEHQDGN